MTARPDPELAAFVRDAPLEPARARPSNLRPPATDNPTPKALTVRPASTLMLIACAAFAIAWFAFAFLGCAGTLDAAIGKAKHAGLDLHRGITAFCVPAYKAVDGPADLERVDRVCLPAKAAFQALQEAHFAAVLADEAGSPVEAARAGVALAKAVAHAAEVAPLLQQKDAGAP